MIRCPWDIPHRDILKITSSSICPVRKPDHGGKTVDFGALKKKLQEEGKKRKRKRKRESGFKRAMKKKMRLKFP